MTAINQKMTEFQTRLRTEGEDIVTTVFPKKILELDEICQSKFFTRNDMEEVFADLNIPSIGKVLGMNNDSIQSGKKRKLEHDHIHVITGPPPCGMVPCNKKIVELVDVIKPHITSLMENCNKVKMWIQLLIPRIEDGNNFGVSIQEETLSEVQRIESEAASFLDQISRYFITRGKITSKIVKYPFLDDYRRTVLELDEKQFVSFKICLCEVRNHYLTLYDSISKNMEKIKKPRSFNSANMY